MPAEDGLGAAGRIETAALSAAGTDTAGADAT
jgi:hypothetical protein